MKCNITSKAGRKKIILIQEKKYTGKCSKLMQDTFDNYIMM